MENDLELCIKLITLALALLTIFLIRLSTDLVKTIEDVKEIKDGLRRNH